MIQSKNDLRLYLREDMFRNLGSTNVFRYWIFLACRHNGAMAFHYLKSLRKYEYAINCYKKYGFLGRLIILYRKIQNRRLGYKYAISIHPNTVGYGLALPHTAMGGVVINCKSMGNYCTVNTGCLLGKKNKDQSTTPIVGDHVNMNPGCCIIGEITVGNHVVVAPHAVITKNVPDYAVVAGVPGKILFFDDGSKNL